MARSSPQAARTLLVVVAILIGVIVALIAGMLASIGGAALSSAITAGGIAFGSAVTLVLLIMSALGLLGGKRIGDDEL